MQETGAPEQALKGYVKPTLKKHGELKQITFSTHDSEQPTKTDTPTTAKPSSGGGTPIVRNVQEGYTGGTPAARQAAKERAEKIKEAEKAASLERKKKILRDT